MSIVNGIIKYDNFAISSLQSENTNGFLLKIDNINYSILNNRMMKMNDPLNIKSHLEKPFIDIEVVTTIK